MRRVWSLAACLALGCGGTIIDASRPPIHVSPNESVEIAFADEDDQWIGSAEHGTVEKLTSHTLRYTAPNRQIEDIVRVFSPRLRIYLLSQTVVVR